MSTQPARVPPPVTSLSVGFVPGVEPDRFARRWSDGPRAARLDLVPVAASAAEQALAAGELDLCFLRLPLAADDGSLHVVPLWEEAPAAVVGAENTLSLFEELVSADLAGEPEIPAAHPDDAAERVAVVASGIGYTRMPLSLARLHHRKDAVHRPAPDREPTRIALVWPREADDPLRQEFVAVVRGRTSRSGRTPAADQREPKARVKSAPRNPEARSARSSGASQRAGGPRKPAPRGGGRGSGRARPGGGKTTGRGR